MRNSFRRLSLLLLTIPLLLLAACSDDDADAGEVASPTSAPAASATVEATSGARSEAAIEGAISVDFTGAPEELEPIEADFEVAPGSTAWDAIKMALGEDNVAFDDFGGDLGVFITGFNGVEAEGDHFWEFKLNGESAESGVGKYEVQQGDMIEFVYSSF